MFRITIIDPYHRHRLVTSETHITPEKPNGHPYEWPLNKPPEEPYRSLFRQLIRSPSVVVELETGCLWLSAL